MSVKQKEVAAIPRPFGSVARNARKCWVATGSASGWLGGRPALAFGGSSVGVSRQGHEAQSLEQVVGSDIK
jgi:hypothetical protein